MISIYSLFYRFFRFILDVLLSRAFWIFIGVLSLSIFIWFAGPLFAFAESKPLETEKARLYLISFVWSIYILFLIIKFWKRKRINGLLLDKIVSIKKSVEENNKSHDTSEEEIELKNIFSDATNKLKSLRISGKSGNGLGNKFIYELPWYIIIGAPGAGKTTALANSGLNFPLSEKYGKIALRRLRGTRNCDSWFTDQAVLIDTAGRYTTHDSNESSDKLEWETFIGLLKKYRPRQPINGVFLTLSTSDLLTYSDDEFDAHLVSLYERLNELQRLFSIEIPIYLWVTKIDLLAGFKEFFVNYDKIKRDQVFGFTFKYSEKSKNNKPNKLNFNEEFSLLEKSLYSLENEHLANEVDLRRRNYIYAFPQQFSTIRSRIERTFDFLFSETKLTDQPFLRGIYFCSGTQEGNVFDRVLNSMRNTFKTAGKVLSTNAQGDEKSYFLHDLLLKLIFPESHLAGRNFSWERKTKLLTYVGYTISLSLLVFLTTAWSISYKNNINYIKEVNLNTENFSEELSNYNNKNNGDLVDLMEILAQLNALGNTNEFSVEDPPLNYRYGLYQGYKVSSSINYSYDKILNDGLLPLISKRLEIILRNPPVDSLEYLYEALKAYLMLYQEENYSREFLIEWMKLDFNKFLLPDSDPKILNSIDFHLNSLFKEDTVVRSPIPFDKELVRMIRHKLSTLSVPQRAYSRLMGRLSNNNLAEFNLLDVAGPQASNVFFRESGLPLNSGIPGIFTYQGYWDIFDKSLNAVVSEVAADEGWVLGLPSQSIKTQLSNAAQGKLIREVRLIYLREYQRIWAEYIKDIKIIPSNSLGSTIQRLSVLSAPDSPLPLFLRGVVRETTLLRKESLPPQITVVDRVKRNITQTRNDIERVIGPIEAVRLNKESKDELIVDHYFEPLRRLVGPPGSQNTSSFPIDNVMKTLDEYYGVLVAADSALKSGTSVPRPDAAIRLKSEASRLPAPLGEMIGTIANESSRQTTKLAYSQLGANLNATVGDFCRKAIYGRYPLNINSNEDITLQDFSRIFSPNGLMATFFKNNLASYVDTTTWTFNRSIDGSHVAGRGSLKSFEKANVIQNVFFSDGGSLPKIRIEMKVIEMDPSISSMALDIDGTIIKYSHGPQLSHSVIWPGPRGKQQVSLQISDKYGEQSAISTEGSWALHRFFDRLLISTSVNQEYFTATADISGKKVKFEVVASSVQNPFRLSQLNTFTCPGNF